MLKDIQGIHERVRAFFEQQERDYRVTRIRGETITDYAPPLHGLTEDPDFIETSTSLAFRVQAEHRTWRDLRQIECIILVAENGKMQIEKQMHIETRVR